MNSFRLSGSVRVETCSAEIDRALDDEDVEAGLDRGLVVVAHALRRQRGRRDHALILDLANPLRDQVLAHRLGVDALHLRGRDLLGLLGDPLELARGVVVAGPDALEVEDGEPAEVAEDAGGLGRDDAVHGRGEQRQVEAVRTERPGDVDVIGIARAPARHYRDVIEAICAAALLAASDLNFHGGILSSAADENLTLPMPNRALGGLGERALFAICGRSVRRGRHRLWRRRRAPA